MPRCLHTISERHFLGSMKVLMSKFGHARLRALISTGPVEIFIMKQVCTKGPNLIIQAAEIRNFITVREQKWKAVRSRARECLKR
jgi:hypothetical protein